MSDTHIPDWIEAYQRQAHLYTHGATPDAFHFKRPFNEHGEAMQLDRAVIQQFRRHAL